MNPIVYISGPITGANAWQVHQNVLKAEAVSAELFQAGITNICVHAQCRNMDGIISHREWLDHDFRLIDRCDAVYVCVEEFAHSVGTVAEIAHAAMRGIQVFMVEERDALIAWARDAAGKAAA